MNQHLLPEDISRWLAGDRTSELEQHVGECEACAARLDRMENSLAEFRGSVQEWTARQTTPAPQMVWQRNYRHTAQRWLLAAASLVILVSASAYVQHARKISRAAEIAREDALLEQVDSEISRAVPQTMEPLVNLVTWGSGPKDEAQSKAN
jgi:anti-sigma factor RsiW